MDWETRRDSLTTMSMSRACSAFERQVRLEDLDRARDGGQGIADLVGDEGRRPAGRRLPLPDLDLPLGRGQGVPGLAQARGQLGDQDGDDEEEAPGQEDRVEDEPEPRFPDLVGAEIGDQAVRQAVGQGAEEDRRQSAAVR